MARHQRIALIARHLSTAGPTPTGPTTAASTAKAVQKQVFRERTDYKYFLPVQTRWSDNDQYGHINNSIYYHYFDTVINEYLMKNCGLDPQDTTGKPIGLVVSSGASFYSPASYPNLIHLGLSITKVGKSSVTYRVGIFQADESLACVVGGFTHVFVDPVHRKPVSKLPDQFLDGVRNIVV